MCCDILAGRRGDVARHGPADDFDGSGDQMLKMIVYKNFDV
jgi:hypothetical protein